MKLLVSAIGFLPSPPDRVAVAEPALPLGLTGSGCSAQHVASTVAGELAFQLRGMRLVLRARTEDDTALLETALVFGRAILRNACANQRADERPCGTICAGAVDGPRDRTRDDGARGRTAAP